MGVALFLLILFCRQDVGLLQRQKPGIGVVLGTRFVSKREGGSSWRSGKVLPKLLGNRWCPICWWERRRCLVAPIVVPVVIAGLRPVAKTAIKGGIYVLDKAQDMVAEAGEQLSDLVAGSRAGMVAAAAAARGRDAT